MLGIEGKAVQVAIGQVKGFLYPSPAERAAAYELLVELSTRTSTTTLAATEGTIREALDSLDAMFDITRSILRGHGATAAKGSAGNLSLAVIAVRVLNDDFRPVLSRWHPLLQAYEDRRPAGVSAIDWERRWPLGGDCRADLNAMRSSIRAYTDTLGHIAGASNLAAALAISPPSTRFEQKPVLVPIPDDAQPRLRMVRWLRLSEMWRAGPAALAGQKSWKAMNAASSSLDVEPAAVFPAEKGRDFWFDYMSDTGDAFDGTAPVAWLMGRREIAIPADRAGELPTPPAALPRAQLVVFGGDEVYPFAGPHVYENQTELPFQLGLEPHEPAEPHELTEQAKLVAIPGNHDWLGGIEHFMKMFGSKRTFAGHWETAQSRTYWHVKLPQGWWLWGIDTGLKDELPPEQVEYFAAAAAGREGDEKRPGLKPGDRVILCTPVPLWQLRQKKPEHYQAIRSALDPLVLERGAKISLCLSGDSHFFAHYESVDPDIEEDHITAGGGGAFLHPTHSIPERIPMESGNMEFRLTTRWPLPADSRALAPSASHLRDRQFWLIMALFAVLHGAFAWLVGIDRGRLPWARQSLVDSVDGKDHGLLHQYATRIDEAVRWTLSSPWALIMLVLLAIAGTGAVKANSREVRLASAARRYGLLIGAGLGTTFVAVAVVLRFFRPSPAWGTQLAAAVIGGVMSTAALFWALSWVNAQIKAGDNLAFSSAHLTRYKHFIRFRIDVDGNLTCFVVGVDPVGQGWWKAMKDTKLVPPSDPAGIPRIHYVWGKTFPKFLPEQVKVAWSVSLDHPESGSLFVRLCTDFLDGGHSLFYGGLPGEGYTAQLSAIERRRHADNPNATRHMVNYLAAEDWPEWTDTTHDDGELKWVKVGRSGTFAESPVVQYIRNLTEMRTRVTSEADLRIVLAGNLTPGKPKERLAPGVLEEAYLSMRAGQPVIILGGFGGVGELIAKQMLGQLDPSEVAALAEHFIEPLQGPDGGPAPGFTEMLDAFGSLSVLRNGLSEGENRELLRTNDPDTAAALVKVAIRRIAGHRQG